MDDDLETWPEWRELRAADIIAREPTPDVLLLDTDAVLCRHCGRPVEPDGRGHWMDGHGFLACVKARSPLPADWEHGEGPVWHQPMPPGMAGGV